MTWPEWVLAVAQLLAFAAGVLFVFRYSHRVWETSPHGRNIMAGSVGIGVAGLLAALHRIYSPRNPAAYLLEALAWLVLVWVLCQRRRLLAAQPRPEYDPMLGPELIGGPQLAPPQEHDEGDEWKKV